MRDYSALKLLKLVQFTIAGMEQYSGDNRFFDDLDSFYKSQNTLIAIQVPSSLRWWWVSHSALLAVAPVLIIFATLPQTSTELGEAQKKGKPRCQPSKLLFATLVLYRFIGTIYHLQTMVPVLGYFSGID